jgi:hypothetical protein
MLTRPGIKYQIDGAVMTYGALMRKQIVCHHADLCYAISPGIGVNAGEENRVALRRRSYPLLTAADARRLAYCRRILT